MGKQKFLDKVALVTGAGSGIGRATALRFASEGASVACADVNETGGQETVKTITKLGGSASFVRTDVSVESDVKALIDSVLNVHGGLDVAFNNAGIALFDRVLDQHSVDDYDQLMEVNATGVFLCMKYEIPVMLERGGGSIVNTASQAGIVGGKGLSVYSATKHAVVGLTKAAALEYARKGIRVNCVAPGIIDTEINQPFWDDYPDLYEDWKSTPPMGRYGTAEEVASAVIWLCTPEAAFVHGHAMAVDAGMLAQ